jgi:hypothetical protein
VNALRRAVLDPYRQIMDSDVNPLRNLPASQRFQVMIGLGMMWTLIFCVGTGVWLWYGHLVVFQVLVALGGSGYRPDLPTRKRGAPHEPARLTGQA